MQRAFVFNMLNITFRENSFQHSQDFIKVNKVLRSIVRIEKREFYTKRLSSRLRFFQCVSVGKIQIKWN